ncbi:MAG: MoaD/ThiS family protein [Vicingaceae bacterium]|nr:MoaD/ThiS family protein [Vicingaceae bacterium]
MTLTIKYFGMTAEGSGKTEESVHSNYSSIAELKKDIINKHPKLEKINFKIAANQTIVNEDYLLSGDEEIALLPPFAGG